MPFWRLNSTRQSQNCSFGVWRCWTMFIKIKQSSPQSWTHFIKMFQCFYKYAQSKLYIDGLLTSILWGKAPLCTEIHFHKLPLRTFCPKLPQPSEMALYLKREIVNYLFTFYWGNQEIQMLIFVFWVSLFLLLLSFVYCSRNNNSTRSTRNYFSMNWKFLLYSCYLRIHLGLKTLNVLTSSHLTYFLMGKSTMNTVNKKTVFCGCRFF